MSQTQIKYVIVKAGDTLASIATRYKTTVVTIARLNNLNKEAVLKAGETLRVPKPKLEPETTVKGSAPPRPRIPRYAFAVHTGQEGVYPSSQKALLREGEEGLSGIFPLWFQASPTEPWKMQSFVTEEAMTDTVRAAKQRHVLVFGTLTNLYYKGSVSGKEVAHQVMNQYRNNFRDTLVNTYLRYGLDGIHVDWTDIYEADQEMFADWITSLGLACRSAGLKLIVNVPVVPEDDGTRLSTRNWNLGRIAKAADWISLLTNTEHRMYTRPGALASYDWTVASVEHVLKRGIPGSKILLGIAGYAYDWKESSHVPEYLSFEGAMNRARQYRVNVQFDNNSQTPMYRYTDSGGWDHEVWFENTSSLSQKITIVNKYDLAGISLWRLGIEDPGIWPLLRYRWGGIRKGDFRFHNICYDN